MSTMAYWILLMLLFPSPSWAKGNICFPHQRIIGGVEKVFLPRLKKSLAARVDSGAKTSSLHGTSAKEISIQGKPFLEFTTDTNLRVRSPLVSRVRIKSALNSEAQTRYVIREKVCLGNFQQEVDINIADRSKLAHKFLIGRNILEKDFLIDVSKELLLNSNCSN